VDHVGHGRYVIRPIGSLHTPAALDDLPLAVGAAFSGRPHRIAYASAMSEYGLLSHPVRTVMVSCTRQVKQRSLGGRPLRVIIEKNTTIHVEAERVRTSWRSTLDRALFESALRVDLIGGSERLAEALVNGAAELHPDRIALLADLFGPWGHGALRRLHSLADVLGVTIGPAPEVPRAKSVIQLDSRDDHVAWIDKKFRVAWNVTPDELQAVVGD
jgi:predicted transcriptional regulator of viral defense system